MVLAPTLDRGLDLILSQRGIMELKHNSISRMSLSVFGLLTLVGGLMGCARGSNAPPTQVVVDPVNIPRGDGYNADDWAEGQTVAFKPSSFATFNTYVGTHPLNNPSEFKINILLTASADNGNLFGGRIRIGYNDAGTWYQGTFETGAGKNVECSQCRDNGEVEAKYNYFYDASGKHVFSGFFQDRYGALVLILEPDSGSGDGDSGSYKGTIFFRNFNQALSTQSANRKCWFIYNGPYICGSNAVYNKSSYTAIDSYTKLGTFSGIEISKISP